MSYELHKDKINISVSEFSDLSIACQGKALKAGSGVFFLSLFTFPYVFRLTDRVQYMNPYGKIVSTLCVALAGSFAVIYKVRVDCDTSIDEKYHVTRLIEN